MGTVPFYSLALAALLALVAGTAPAQEPAGPDPALENALVQSIAGAEKSVVAIARVHREQPGDSVRLEFRPDLFGSQVTPTDPNFIPNEYGTGVIVDSRGLILTAAHVLGDENDSYYITTSERRVYRAWIKASDPRSDLAVLGIDGSDRDDASAAKLNLTPIRLGNAASLRKGQIVVTLGNPYAIARDGQASAGWGIVSNLGRKTPPAREADPGSEPLLQRYGGLIQTDARLHLGASGGPLLNLKGEMVGLCVSTVAMAGFESPAGYAIPVDDMFRRVLDVLKQGREAEYGYLGIHPYNLKPAQAAQLHDRDLQGIQIRIEPYSPAAQAKLRDDDIITTVNGRPIYEPDGLVLEVGRLPVESVVKLGVFRDDKVQTIDVVLSKFPVRGRKIVTVRADAWRGMRVDYASAFLEADQPLRLTDEAVVVMDVDPNTPAAQSGVKKGMLISQVDGRAVRTPRDFQAAIAEKSGAVQLKLVVSDPSSSLLVVPP